MTRARKGSAVRQWEDRFLSSLKTHANVSAAARTAGISTRTAYNRRNANSEFAELWEGAIKEALDALELAVYSGGMQGNLRAAMWFLSRRRPEVWGDRVALEHSGPEGERLTFTLKLGEEEDSRRTGDG